MGIALEAALLQQMSREVLPPVHVLEVATSVPSATALLHGAEDDRCEGELGADADFRLFIT